MRIPKPLLFLPPGSLDESGKKLVQKNGYVLIETDATPRVMQATGQLPIDAMARLALDVVGDFRISDFNVRGEFQKRIMEMALKQSKEGVV